jgi:tetratricopeptide (TPR) repeat protein
MGNFAEAIAEYRVVLEDHPPLPETYFNLARAYSSLGKKEQALRQLQTALSLKPDFEAARHEILSLEGRLE